MVRLVVSDVDGTLAEDGTNKVNPRLFEIIHELKKKDILFAVASGRQLPSIARLFEPVKDNIIFIAENGAYVVCRDTEMSAVPMEREYVKQLVKEIRQQKQCILTMSGRNVTYIESHDEEFVDLLVNGYKNTIQIVDDVLKVDTQVIKIAVYVKEGITKIAEDYFIPNWNNDLKVVIAGYSWLDFMNKQVDKGNALARIQQMTGIKQEETISFGDNSNDLGMFIHSGKSYAVANAREEVRQAADCVIGSYKEESVIKELEKLL